jgi:hypothetical protein
VHLNIADTCPGVPAPVPLKNEISAVSGHRRSSTILCPGRFLKTSPETEEGRRVIEGRKTPRSRYEFFEKTQKQRSRVLAGVSKFDHRSLHPIYHRFGRRSPQAGDGSRPTALNDPFFYGRTSQQRWNGRNMRSTYRLCRRLLEQSIPQFATVFIDPRAK